MYRRCPQCGAAVNDRDAVCPSCHTVLNSGRSGYQYQYRESEQYLGNEIFASDPYGKSRGVAALLAIFLGGFGIQYFYLNKSTAGLICLLVSICSCGILGSVIATISLIQGIYMLFISNQEFTAKYVTTPSSFPIF